MKTEAALHGAKIEGESERKAKADEIMFKDPKEYAKLSPKERRRASVDLRNKLLGLKMPGLGKGSSKRVKI